MQYKVYLTSKVNPSKLAKGSGIIVIEPDDYSKDKVKAIKDKGYKVLGYLSIGTIEKERSWYEKYKDCRLKKVEDWPNEYYADCTKTEWQKFIFERAKSLKSKGFDGLWCDNLDVYEYNKSFEMYTDCKKILTELKKLDIYIMVNGGKEFFYNAIGCEDDLTKMVNGVTQEEVFSRITSYSGKGKFGTQDGDENRLYVAYLKKLKKRGVQTFLLEYSTNTNLINKIKDFCTKNGMTGYYISKDVNL